MRAAVKPALENSRPKLALTLLQSFYAEIDKTRKLS